MFLLRNQNVAFTSYSPPDIADACRQEKLSSLVHGGSVDRAVAAPVAAAAAAIATVGVDGVDVALEGRRSRDERRLPLPLYTTMRATIPMEKPLGREPKKQHGPQQQQSSPPFRSEVVVRRSCPFLRATHKMIFQDDTVLYLVSVLPVIHAGLQIVSIFRDTQQAADARMTITSWFSF